MLTHDQDHSSRFDETYYKDYFGGRYERSPEWLGFFGNTADRIIASLHPLSTLDVGCAYGFLVEALAQRGVAASGIDVSEYAISQAHESIADACTVASATEEIKGSYELITCIEVLEHLPPADAPVAVASMTQASNQILFSSTPGEFAEPTHINVRPVEYWANLFAEHGFFRDFDFDASFLTPWATLFRRVETSAPRVVLGYERELWHAQTERDELRKETQRLWSLLNEHGIFAINDGLNDQESGGGTSLAAQNAELVRQVESVTQELWSARDALEGAIAARGTALGRLGVTQLELASLTAEHEEWEASLHVLHEEHNAAKQKLEGIKGLADWRLAQGAKLAARGKRKLLK